MTASMTTSPKLPGRLGNPGGNLKDDPRADPRMLAAMAPLGLDVAPPPSPVDATTPLEDILAYTLVAEAGFDMLGGVLGANAAPVTGVTSYTEVIKGVDGNDISLYVHKPTNVSGPVPCIVHTHGGGMAILKASNPNYVRWRDDLAATGLVVVGVEFRNAAGALGPFQFPAGLNDCASGAQWAIANKAALGISKVIISGESGGGNLALATALKANKEGWISDIAGVYAQCPYISNAYANPPAELTSLFENDDYFLNVANMGRWPRPTRPTRPTPPIRSPGRSTRRRPIWPGFPRTSSRSTSSTRCATRDLPISATWLRPG